MKHRTPVINLFGGPGTGKSTTMAAAFAHLKQRGVTAEMAPEWFKGKVWEGTAQVLANDQTYVFAKQNHELRRLMDCGVAVAITDAPLLLSLVYGAREPESFKRFVVEKFAEYRNVNVFLNRVKHYDPEGRLQTEAEARGIDVQVREVLDFLGIFYYTLDAGPEAGAFVAALAKEALIGWE